MYLLEEWRLSLFSFNMNVHQILYVYINMIVVQIYFLHTVLELGAVFILELFKAVLCVQLLNLVFLANIFVQVLVKLKITGYEVWFIPTLIINYLPN